MLTKLKTFKTVHKVHLNLCLPIHSHVSEYTIYISTYVDHTHSMQARKQYVSQLVLNKLLLTLRIDKIYLTLCCPNTSRSSKDTKHISTCTDQNLPCQQWDEMYLNMLRPYLSHASNAKNVSQHVMTKPIPCQRGYKMHLYMC